MQSARQAAEAADALAGEADVRNRKVSMKAFRVSIAVGLLLGVVGCSDSTEPLPPSVPPTYGEVQYYGETYDFGAPECFVSGTEGGVTKYSLRIRFVDSENRAIEFSVQDQENNPANLVTVGEHPTTGQHWDGIHNRMQPATFTINHMDSDQLAVVWEEVTLDGRTFSGTGYIDIRERIELACADSIFIGGGYAHPGDPEYDSYYEAYCAPGYYYPAQKIWFVCEEGAYSY